MDNQLSCDDEILYLNSGFDILANNFAVFSKLKTNWLVKTYKSFKIKLPAKTTVTDYISKTGHLIHNNKPAIFHIKPFSVINSSKTEPAGCYYLILAETSDANKNLLTKNLSYKQLLKYHRYECN